MPQNTHLARRLAGIQTILNGVHQASATMTAASKGHERAAVIDEFLSQVFPSQYRFGTGDATDKSGQQSGQLDVVVENPYMPSVPLGSKGTGRLYLAEGIAAVIEIKSDVSAQWDEALGTARKLASLRRPLEQDGLGVVPEAMPSWEAIPFFVVGYKGWQKAETLKERLKDGPVDGILVIDPGLFVSSSDFNIEISGPLSLWGLVSCIYACTNTRQWRFLRPDRYATD